MRRPAADWAEVAREVLVVAAGIAAYFGVRGRTHSQVEEAVGNARRLMDVERSIRIDVEPTVQAPIRGSEVLTYVANWIYIWGHWPVILVTLLWLFLQHRRAYLITRNAMLISGAVGLVIFAMFPVAPPRLADPGMLDTVTQSSVLYRVLQPKAFVNQYAAMPSLHMGWDLLVGMAIAQNAARRWMKITGWLLPALMAWSVVATANHYVVDVVAGIVVVLASRAAALRWSRRRPGRVH